MSGAVRVVVMDRSVVGRARLIRALEAGGDISVKGYAIGLGEVVALTERERPHVLVMDLHALGSVGLRAIEEVMARAPTPILVISSPNDQQVIKAALAAGALDAAPPLAPVGDGSEADLRQRVAALSNLKIPLERPDGGRPPFVPVPPTLVAIAASAGGPKAVADVLAGLAGLAAAILVIQHLQVVFLDGFVAWMARVSALPVEVAVHGTALRPGRVYVGQPGQHLKVDSRRHIVLDPMPASLHRPSANELFHSLARHAPVDGVGVLLTGMGNDGAEGLLALRQSGGTTIVQDEASALFGAMPEAARRLGAAERVLALPDIPAAIGDAVRRRRR